MVLLTSLLVVAAVNLCLGYGLAACLGHAPPSVKAGWKSLSAGGPALAAADTQEGPARREGAKVHATRMAPEVAEAMDKHFGPSPS